MNAPGHRKKEGPPPAKSDPERETENARSKAHAARARKLFEAAQGHRWHFRKGSHSCTARIGEDGIWRIGWAPKVPKQDTPQGARIWAAYFQWRNEIAQDLVDRAGVELWIAEKIETALVAMRFAPKGGEQ